MTHTRKLILSILTGIMFVCLLPQSIHLSLLKPMIIANAATSGICGENLSFSYAEGVLTISGTGDMWNFPRSWGGKAPWDTEKTFITTIVIEDKVTSIGDHAFEGCEILTSVNIPQSVTSIGEYSFNNCDGLKSVNIPQSVTSIGKYSFYNCKSLKSVTFPNNITRIEQSTFEGSGLESFIIPDSITSIGAYAFDGCPLKSITFPNSVTSIEVCAFAACHELTSVTIPGSVKDIEYGIFLGCDKLTSVTIQEGVTSIGDVAFYTCFNLTSVIIPDSVTSIGDMTFSNCESLTSVTIPKSVTSIGVYAFAYCKSLTSVTIPKSVTSVGDYAFAYCNKLAFVISKSDTPAAFGDCVFTECNAEIYVPAASVEAYKSELVDYADKINTYELADGKYIQTAYKNEKYYIRFVFVVPKAQFAGKNTAEFTVTYNNTDYIYKTDHYYTGVISNGVPFVPLSEGSAMFVVTISSNSDISNNLKCKLDFK